MEMKNSNRKGEAGVFATVFAVILIAIMLIVTMGLSTVEPSNKGVVVEFGKITGTQDPGMEWTGVFAEVHTYDLKLRKMSINMGPAVNGLPGNAAVDKSGQAVYANIQVNYRFKSSAAEKAYKEIGKDVELESNLNIKGIIEESFKTVTSKYDTLEIFQQREKVKAEAIAAMKISFPKDYFVLENVVISNLDFNEAFKRAIEQTKINEETEKAKAAEVKIAKQQADISIAQARGRADSEKLSAEAKAYQITVMAEAEAKALELKAAELTTLMVEQNRIDAWNGVLPQYVLGSNTELLMNMGDK